MVANVILNILLQLLYTVGAIIVFGVFISFCNAVVYKLLGNTSRAFVIATGIIGTPIHELSHAGMCLIFGHKITAIKLFDPRSPNGVLGYVSHSYNKKNIYHVIGNFFIGVAPIVFGSLILLFLQWALVPNIYSSVMGSIVEIDPNNFFNSTFKAVGNIIVRFFSGEAVKTWTWWVFLILGLSIALHMELSPADIKGAVPGLITIVALSIVINIVVALCGIKYSNSMTSGIAYFGVYLVGILIITAIFAVILSLVALIIKLLKMMWEAIAKRSA